MKVWIISKNGGYEGYSKPLAAYSTYRDVETFLAGTEASFGYGFEVFEFDVDCADDNPPPNWGGAG